MKTEPKPFQVLLVDDSDTFLAALREYVAEFSRIIVAATAKSGEQAVALVGQLSPDLVLMDLDMPGIGGIEATRIIKSLPQRPLVAVVTMHDAAQMRRAGLDAGADFFMVKSRLHEEFPGMLARIAAR